MLSDGCLKKERRKARWSIQVPVDHQVFPGRTYPVVENGLSPPTSSVSEQNVFVTETPTHSGTQMVLNLISSLSNFLTKWQFRRVFVAFRCFAFWHDSWGAQKLSILLSYPMDDSYTPATLAVRAGTGLSDLQDVRVISLEKPDGWITFDISGEPNDGLAPVYAFVLQVIILANHMNGKDTHVRGLRILGPIEDQTYDGDPFVFESPLYKLYETIR